MAAGNARRNVPRSSPAPLRRLLLGVVHQFDGRTQTLLQLGAGLGNADLTGRALDKANAQTLLHGGKALGDNRRMALQQPTRRDKGTLRGDGQECSDLIAVLIAQDIKIHGFRMIAPEDRPVSRSACASAASANG